MSVINQMLKDLESRRTADTGGHGLLRGEGAHGRSGIDRKWLLLSLLIALLALSLAYLLWERFSAPVQTAPAPTDTAEAAAPQTQIVKKNPAPETNTPEVEKPVLKPVPIKSGSAPAPVKKAAPVQEKATVTPSPALHAIEPSTVTGSWQAQTFTLTGSSLPKSPRIKVSWRDGEKVLAAEQITRRDSEHLTITLTTGLNADTWTVTLIDGNATPQQFRVQHPQSPTRPAPSKTGEPSDVKVTETADIEKRIHPLRPAQQAEQLYQQGYRLLQNGDQSGAEKQWDKAIQIDPTHIPGREGLAGLYLNHGRGVEATELLAEGLRHHPGHGPFANLYARTQVQNGRLDDAISTLEQALTTQPQDADFHAFLAALFQRQKAFDKSIAAYRQALQQQPGQSVWWMGAAISLESAGKADEAVSAYNKALSSGNLSPKLRSYVEGRLATLQ